MRPLVPSLSFDPQIPFRHRKIVEKLISDQSSKNVPVILSIEHFSKYVGISEEFLVRCSNSQKLFYREFNVAGSNKVRKISAPLPALLDTQRWILDNILYTVDLHPSAKAYVKRSSVKANAKFHRAQAELLKLDFRDFFGSIGEYQISSIFRELGYSKSVSIFLSKVCTLDGVLPQGAPTSGALSNILLKSLDDNIFAYCKQRNLRYTRYADDIAISGGKIPIKNIVKLVSQEARKCGLKINHKKTSFAKQNNRQKVTGVIVNQKLSVERDFLRELRQQIYYVEKYGLLGHARYIGAKSPRSVINEILGKISFAMFIKANDEWLRAAHKKMLHVRRENEFLG